MREMHARPEVKEKHSASLRAAHKNDPSLRLRTLAGMTPEVIKRRNASIRAAHARKRLERLASAEVGEQLPLPLD